MVDSSSPADATVAVSRLVWRPVNPILGLDESVTLFWPAVSIGTAVIITGILWLLLDRWDSDVTSRTGIAGGLLLFGQTLDAMTTMIGIDVLGFSEQVRLSRLIIDATASLPFVSALGTTWTFVLLKLGLASGIVIWTGQSADLSSIERRVILGIATMTGVIPAVNNLVLQSLS